MNLWKGILTIFFLSAAFALPAQQTAVYTEANNAYLRGLDFFNKNIYGLAQKEFKSAAELLRPVNEPEWKAVKTEAELYVAKCAVRLDQPEAEKLTLDFLREQSPSPVASQAALEIGDYYFNQKEYDKALIYYDMAPDASGGASEEIRFKKGYSHFVSKRFGQAKSEFAPLTSNPSGQWYIPANYYTGCCAFFEGKYDDALNYFKRCEKAKNYETTLPYYLVQIYFSKKQYDQVISYGAPKAQDANVKNRSEINQLVGQAYFEKGDYRKALPYLEYAAVNGLAQRPSDYYQLGFAQYQSGQYKPAIENFEQLSKKDSLYGQNGLYHLGDCYLKTGNKFNARTAFGQAASMNYDPSVKEDALINYAKLSYELKFDRDAIDALMKFNSTSRYYPDAMTLLSDIIYNTRDYDFAVNTLENVKNRTPKVNAAYQWACYNRGVQLYQNGQKEEARRFFNKSLDAPVDKRLSLLSSFWMGSIANESEEWNISKQHLITFLNGAKSYNDLPEESNMAMGQYIQGYNLIRQEKKDYKGALTNFKGTVDWIKKNKNSIKSEQIKSAVLGDAVLRAGDCHFVNKEYSSAFKYYDEAEKNKYKGFEYALYQKAMILGLQNKQLDKAVALQSLIEKYPKSQYTDEALLELGNTQLGMGNFAEANQAFRQLITDYRGTSPYVNKAYMQLGVVSVRQGNYSAAANYYKQVFSNNPETQEAKDALVLLEEAYKEMGRPEDYFDFLETVPGYKVSNASRDSVVYQSAEYQYENGKYQLAIDGFTNYLAKYPKGNYLKEAYYYRAESYATDDIKKYNLAIKDYDAVINKGPGRLYVKAAEKAAWLSLNTENNPAQALEYARKWENAAPNDASRLNAQLFALEAAYKSGNSVTVNEYADKVNRSPLATGEHLALSNFYLGKIAFDKGDYNRAYPALESVTENSSAEMMAESYHLMAQVLYRQKKYNDAEELITGKANKNSAAYHDWIARNLILLSDIYLDQGDKNSASAALEMVLENYKGGNQAIINAAQQKYDNLGKAPANPKPDNDKNSTQKGGNLLEMEGGN